MKHLILAHAPKTFLLDPLFRNHKIEKYFIRWLFMICSNITCINFMKYYLVFIDLIFNILQFIISL